MAAAYAALVSLMHIIKQLQCHPRPPISLDKQQVDSLTENVTFLQRFLEGYSSSGSQEDDVLESRIADAAYAAEDVIESHIVDQIHRGSTSHGEEISSVDLYQDLQKVIQDMDSIKKEVMEIATENTGAHGQLHSISSISTGSSTPAPTTKNGTMVDFDGVEEVMDKLTGQEHNLRIIPIVGMGGIGKTTLARNIYASPLIVEHFVVLAWVTISQKYSRREILRVLCEENKWSTNDLSLKSEDEIGEELYKSLWGRRYLIVMDDIWSLEAWDKVKSFFPDNNNGSRIMITTRLSNLAFQLSGSHDFHMNLLDKEKSWNLLCETVYGKDIDCPSELEKIGRKIAESCRGLPLSLVVIGGLLTRSKMIQYWEYTLKNLNSLINLENNEHCLQVLRTSYKELPIHLKPCFLYMGVFPEDFEIRMSKLIKLWVAEGFLKPIDGKSLEVAAEEYIEELINRNLILVHELGWNEKVRSCKIHDLLRDLCLREAEKQKFLCILRQPYLKIPEGISTERRICIHNDAQEKYSQQMLNALETASLTRSSILTSFHELSPSNFRLLRVYTAVGNKSIIVGGLTSVEAIIKQANLRYLSIRADLSRYKFPSSLALLWNLQTIIVENRYITDRITASSAIWKMFQLRHFICNCGIRLSDPPNREDIVLENLQTLSYIKDFKCSIEVVKRIPNIKKLKFRCWVMHEGYLPNHCLNNLGRLQKLECLELEICVFFECNLKILQRHLRNLTLPHSLKKLTLSGTTLRWNDLTTKIGVLPLLEVLKLEELYLTGQRWKTVEGHFCSLKFLLIEMCSLDYWRTDKTHFPRLEHLVLRYLRYLEKIPSSIGDIPTLQSIHLKYCSHSAVNSAMRIKRKQEELGNEDLRVQIFRNEAKEMIDEEDEAVSDEEED